MTKTIENTPDGEKVTGLIVTAGGVPRRAKLPRRFWRRIVGDAGSWIEPMYDGLIRYERSGLRGTAANTRVRINYRHPLALPLTCILIAALPLLAVGAAIRPMSRWCDRRKAQRRDVGIMGSHL